MESDATNGQVPIDPVTPTLELNAGSARLAASAARYHLGAPQPEHRPRVTQSAEVGFFHRRSKAVGDHRAAFANARGLALDVGAWPEQDRRDFEVEAEAIAAYWHRVAERLMRSLSDESLDSSSS